MLPHSDIHVLSPDLGLILHICVLLHPSLGKQEVSLLRKTCIYSQVRVKIKKIRAQKIKSDSLIDIWGLMWGRCFYKSRTIHRYLALTCIFSVLSQAACVCATASHCETNRNWPTRWSLFTKVRRVTSKVHLKGGWIPLFSAPLLLASSFRLQ